MDSRFTIDLNQPPPIIDHGIYIEEGDIPISATHSSSEHVIIELNEDNHATGYPVIELNLREFMEDIDGASSDSSDEEEIVAQQTTEVVDRSQARQGLDFFFIIVQLIVILEFLFFFFFYFSSFC